MASEKNNIDNASGSGTAPETPKAKPSDKQIGLLAIIMQNLEDQPKINWENVAAQAGLKNERVAKETYRQMCKKFGWTRGGSAAAAAPGSTPTKKVMKRTGKVGSARKTRSRKAAAAAAAAASDDGDGDCDDYQDEDEKPRVDEEAAYAAELFMSGAV